MIHTVLLPLQSSTWHYSTFLCHICCVYWALDWNSNIYIHFNPFKLMTKYILTSFSFFHTKPNFSSVQFSCSVVKILCDPMNCSTPGLPVHHQLPKFTQTHVHRVGDAIQPSHPLLSLSPPAPNPSQLQGLFKWGRSSHQVAKILEFQFQHQSFQWTPRTDLL